jgi:hypothetical protein
MTDITKPVPQYEPMATLIDEDGYPVNADWLLPILESDAKKVTATYGGGIKIVRG